MSIVSLRPSDAHIPFRQDECVNPASATGCCSIDQAELFEQKARTPWCTRFVVPLENASLRLSEWRWGPQSSLCLP